MVLLLAVLQLLMMFPVWLHGYPDSSIQAASNHSLQQPGQRIRCQFRLPKPEWFKQRELAADIPRGTSDRSPCRLRALAKVEVGAIWENDLTHLNEEQFYGLEFLMYPSDYFSLRILEVFPLQEAVPVASAKSLVLRRRPDGVVHEKQQDFFNVQLASLTQPFLPYLPGLSLSALDLSRSQGPGGFSVQQALNDWGLHQLAESCLVVPLPETLLQMVLQGLWKHVPCLGRWRNLLHQVCEADQRRVGWPGNCAPQATDGSLSQTKVLELVKTLQSWAPVLLQDSDEGHEGRERKLELLGAVRWLLNVWAALPGDSDVLPSRSVVYDSMFLVRCLLMSRLMPAYVSWKEVCIHSLQLLFPDLLKDSLKYLLEHLFPARVASTRCVWC